MWKFFLPLLKPIRFDVFVVYIYFFMLVCSNTSSCPSNFSLLIIFLQSPPPPSISSSQQKKQSIITPPLFAADWDPSEPIIVLLVLSLAASFVSGLLLLGSGGRGQPSVCLPAPFLPPPPWLCLAVLALKGRRLTGFTHPSITRLGRNQLFHKQKNAHGSSVLTASPLLCLWLFKSFCTAHCVKPQRPPVADIHHSCLYLRY